MSALAVLARGLMAEGGGDLSYGAMKRGFRELLTRDPLDSLLVTVVGGSYLFWLAEKDHNPKCTTLWDALVFITTSLSVGYDDVFARTPSGKAIASFVMTFGPALSAQALDPPAAERPEPTSLEVQKQILERLDAILGALRPTPPAA
jgi:hypothetical protein